MTDEEIERNYVLSSVEYYIDSAKEEIAWTEGYLEKLIKQKEIVEKTKFKKVVTLSKNSWTKPVEYDVVLHHIPQIEGGKNTAYERSAYKNFRGGAKKKEAMEYAKTLAEKYQAELIYQ
jgi:hypothetical protein